MADQPPTHEALSELAAELARTLVAAAHGHPVPEHEIGDTFKWDDPTQYRWRIRRRLFASTLNRVWYLITAVLGAMAAGLTIAILPLWLIGLKWPRAAFWCGVVLLAFFLLNLLKDHLLFVIGTHRIRLLMQTHLVFFAVFPMLIVSYLMMSPVPVMREGFSVGSGSAGSWALFFLDHIADVVLLGFPDALGWNWSGVEAAAWHTRVASQLLKMLIAVGLIDLVLLMRSLAFGDIEFYGTVQDASFQCHPLKNFDGFLRREAKVVTLPTQTAGVAAFRNVYPYSPAHGWN